MVALARVLVRRALRRAERAVDRPFDPRASRRIDGLRAALEALEGLLR
ncbi:MAG TPA: hypothetical protein VIH11_04830 [Gemmatimonadaceae bacterium]